MKSFDKKNMFGKSHAINSPPKGSKSLFTSSFSSWPFPPLSILILSPILLCSGKITSCIRENVLRRKGSLIKVMPAFWESEGGSKLQFPGSRNYNLFLLIGEKENESSWVQKNNKNDFSPLSPPPIPKLSVRFNSISAGRPIKQTEVRPTHREFPRNKNTNRRCLSVFGFYFFFGGGNPRLVVGYRILECLFPNSLSLPAIKERRQHRKVVNVEQKKRGKVWEFDLCVTCTRGTTPNALRTGIIPDMGVNSFIKIRFRNLSGMVQDIK